MTVIPLPVPDDPRRSTIHVMGDRVEGFSVSHESASGSSWGAFNGPFRTGQEAIVFAYAMNRDDYGGDCNVYVCDAAMEDTCPGVGLVSFPGDF